MKTLILLFCLSASGCAVARYERPEGVKVSIFTLFNDTAIQNLKIDSQPKGLTGLSLSDYSRQLNEEAMKAAIETGVKAAMQALVP